MKRHYTSSAIIIKNDSVLLHSHKKIKLWLPPGGHVELNEDPVQALHREVLEETGLKIEVINASKMNPRNYKNVYSIIPPFTIFIEAITDNPNDMHEHIDFIYLCKIVRGKIKNNNWVGFTKNDILKRQDQSYNLSTNKELTDELIDLCIQAFKVLEE